MNVSPSSLFFHSLSPFLSNVSPFLSSFHPLFLYLCICIQDEIDRAVDAIASAVRTLL